MPIGKRRRFVPVWVLACAAVTLITLAGAWSWEQYRRADRFRGGTYKIGVVQNPPNYDWSDRQGATGFAVDVMNEAARRAGVKLVWVHCPRGSRAAIRDGVVDLWPTGYYRPEEYPEFHQTRPWLDVQHALVWVQTEMPREAENWDGKRIAVTDTGASRSVAERWFPTSNLVPARTRQDVFRTLCAGRADAAFLNMWAVESGLLNRPEECAFKELRLKPMPRLTDRMTVISRQELGPLADVLRERIDDMIADGAVLEYTQRWFSFSSTDVAQMLRLNQRNQQLRWLIAICVAMGLAIGLLAWLIRNLRLARAGADRSRRLQAEFLTNVSHEIRTPMNGVLGTADLMLDTVDDPETREQIETIRESAYGQLELLNQILDQSKIDSGVLLLEITPFSPRRLVEQVEKTFLPAARRKGIWLRTDIPLDLPAMVQGDGLRIRQVLTNLVNNAVKFTANGGVEISVRAAFPGAGLELSFGVFDSGIGIPAAVQGTIFEKFRQVDASTTRKYGGTGLGLSISRQLVRLMGGDLTVESEMGKGSQFRFRVPLGAARAAPKADAPGQAVSLAGLHVLVVEDNLVNQRVAQALLQRLGAMVELAGNGLEAVARCRESEFDVVLMDCHMPEMDGYAATREIRKLSGAICRVPIVALTAGVSGEERRKAAQSGMDSFLTKPVNREELAAALVALPRRESPAA